MRINSITLLLFVSILVHGVTVMADSDIFELRTYTTFDGKLDDLHARFRDHTMALFEKHGMRNVAYWTPVDKTNTLVYIVAHKNEGSIEPSWQVFGNDPAWQKVYTASIANGRIVEKIVNQFLSPTQYSSVQKAEDVDYPDSSRHYELRTYTANPGKLANLHARFRDHTIELFGRHGIESVMYTTPVGDGAPANTLVYLISHANTNTAQPSWQSFIKDPDWRDVYANSRRDGPLVIKGGIVNLFLEPTDYSPLQ